MNRTDRLYALREELRRAGTAGRTAERLAAMFEVSVRTVKRDVSSLQQGGFPVWARPGPGGGYVVDSAATLPPVNFTDAEISGLAAAVAAHRGQPFERDARAALVKALGVMAPPSRARAQALTARVWIDHAATEHETRTHRAVEEALREQRVLLVDHADRSSRPLDPVLLARTQGRWWLVARCRELDEIVWIALADLASARVTREPASDVPVEAVGRPPATAATIDP